jgi:hypothetical protein
MEGKKFKRIIVTIALLGVFLTFGTGIKKAEAANIDNAGLSAIISGYYQAYGEFYCANAFYYNDTSYYYDAYIYFAAARDAAYDAAVYAANSYATYAYDAYVNAMAAYDNLAASTTYAYNRYYYGTSGAGDLAVLNGGLGAQYLALVQYYAAYLY